jgi:hypothetical protein
MIINKAATVISIAILFLANSAHAELQTWRLTATSYQAQNGFTPPAFATVGNNLEIDYVIDTTAAADSGEDSSFSGAIKSFTINGTTSQSAGYIINWNGLNAINVWPITARMDGIDFISFNNFSGVTNSDITSALSGFSAAAQTTSTDLRIDFGDPSVWARPTSFVMLAVPEPTSALLLLIGIPLVLLRKFGSRKFSA